MKRGLVVVVVAAALALAGSARANGRFPASNAMVFDPSDPSVVYARVTFGLLRSRDAGRTWRLTCERAVGYSSQEDPTYVVTPKGTIVAGLSEGLRVSTDHGCSFRTVDTAGAKSFVDVTMRPDGVIYALSSRFDRTSDAGASLFRNEVWISKDDGATFAPIGAAIDPKLLAESLEVSASDASRVYVSAVDGAELPRRGALLVSTDGGKTFTRREIPAEPHEIAPFIAAVDPAAPATVWVRTAGPPDKDTHLLVTRDAGKAWTVLVTAKGPLHGFARSAAGDLYAGGPGAGLFVGAAGAAPTKRSDLAVQCLGVAGDTLWACSHEASGFFLGTSGDRGGRFDARLHIGDIQGLLECPGSDIGTTCAAEWAELARTIGRAPDDAPADAGAKPAVTAPPPPPGLPLKGPLLAALVVAAIAGGFLLARRKR